MKRVILLADDSPTIQRLVPQTFVDADFEVVSVSNGDAAVRKFEEMRPAIVLADIYMPGKNGYEVCEYIRKHAELGQTPVILLAGAFDVFDADTARQIGASAHITKPFEPQALVNLVISLVSNQEKDSHAAIGHPLPEGEGPQPAAAAEPAGNASTAGIPIGIPLKLEKDIEPAPSAETPAADASPAPMRQFEPEPSSDEPESISVPMPEPVVAAAPAEPPAPAPAPVSASTAAPPAATTEADSGDVLGLNDIFKPASAGPVTEEEIERIANRVIQKLSTQVIENVAWDVVPEITTKVLRDELKRQS